MPLNINEKELNESIKNAKDEYKKVRIKIK